MRSNEQMDKGFSSAIRTAAGCGANPGQVLTVAMAFLDASTVDDALDQLIARRQMIARAVADTPVPHRAPAPPPDGPLLARIRPDIADHEVRGKLLFAELLGKKSFFQVAALAIAGLLLSDADAQLVERCAVIFQVADPGIWPLAVVRRAAASGRPFSARVLAGVATMLNPYLAAIPTARFVAVLERIEVAQARGVSLESWLDETLATGERLPGVGRPVLKGIDERIPQMLQAARRCGRHDGPSVRLTLELERRLVERKGIRLNAGGIFAALMRDLGFSADAIGAFIQLYLMVPILMHAVLDTSVMDR